MRVTSLFGRALFFALAIVAGAALMAVPSSASCNLYVSSSGRSANSGISAGSPIPLGTAVRRTRPGNVICLMAGQYHMDMLEISRSGTSNAWVTYTNYNGVAEIIASGDRPIIEVGPGVQYIEIKGLQLEGLNWASVGIACWGCNHLRIIGNQISHTGAAGISTSRDTDTGQAPDYITADHNLIYHCGYNQGFSSGITYDRNGWSDTYAGFHSFVTNNIISGMYDNSYHKSDGNGIISDNQPGDVTPPELIANNVVYQNGRRCISAFRATNAWVVNNTCYKNDLYRSAGEFQNENASRIYEVNNISYGWNTSNPYLDVAPLEDTHYEHNLWISSGTGRPSVVPFDVINEPAALKRDNPVFVNAPYVSPYGGGQYNNAVPPENITDQFHLQSGSPAIAAGIDPTTLPGIANEIVDGLKAYVYTDIEGNRREPGSRFDLGAYVH